MVAVSVTCLTCGYGHRGLRLVLERQGRCRARLGWRWSDDRGHPARIRFGHSLPQMGRASRSRTPFGGNFDRILEINARRCQ